MHKSRKPGRLLYLFLYLLISKYLLWLFCSQNNILYQYHNLIISIYIWDILAHKSINMTKKQPTKIPYKLVPRKYNDFLTGTIMTFSFVTIHYDFCQQKLYVSIKWLKCIYNFLNQLSKWLKYFNSTWLARKNNNWFVCILQNFNSWSNKL